MMKSMIRIMAACIVLSAVLACTRAKELNPADNNFGTLEVAVDVAPDTPPVRSSAVSDPSGVSDVNIYIYHDGELVWETFSRSMTGITARLPAGKSYSIYATANEGDREAPLYESELSSYVYHAPSDGHFQSGKIPMSSQSAVIKKLEAGDNRVTIPLVRMAACLDFRLDTSGLQFGTFMAESVTLKQANGAVSMFAASNTAALPDLIAGDNSSQTDISLLNAGGTASFYMLENCQGTLLPGNTDPWRKEYYNESIRPSREVCTYLELTGTYRDGSGGLNEKRVYKMYLGDDATTNFDVVRNSRYVLTLVLSDLGAYRDSWKVERRDITDVRQMFFYPDALDIYGASSVSSVLQCSPDGMSHFLDWDEGELAAAGLEVSETPGGNVVFRCMETPAAERTCSIRAYSFDRQICAVCSVSVHPVPLEPLEIFWRDRRPAYVAQAGVIDCRNVYDGSVLTAMSSDVSVARVVENGGSFRIEAIKEGSATITVVRTDGGRSSTKTLDVEILPVYLQLSGRSYEACADGGANAWRTDSQNHEEWRLSYNIERTEFDDALYAELLRPASRICRAGTSDDVDIFTLDESKLVVSSWHGNLSAVPGRYDVSIRPCGDVYSGHPGTLDCTVEVPFPVMYSGSLAFECENRYYMPETGRSIVLEGSDGVGVSLGDRSSLALCLTRLDSYGTGSQYIPCGIDNSSEGYYVTFSMDYDTVAGHCGLHEFRGPGYNLYGRLTNRLSGESDTFKLGPVNIFVALAATSRLERWVSYHECDSDGDYFLIPCLYHEKLPSNFIDLGRGFDSTYGSRACHLPQALITGMPDRLDLVAGPAISLSESYPDPSWFVYSAYHLHDKILGGRCLSLTKTAFYILGAGNELWDGEWYDSLAGHIGGWLHLKYGWKLYDPISRTAVPDGGHIEIRRYNDTDYYLRIYDYAKPLTEEMLEE